METLLLVAVMGAVNIACFIIGAKVGQTVEKGKDIRFEFPTVSPIQGYKAHRKKIEVQKEQDKMDTIMQNIECYDGTSIGQKEVK